MTTFVVVMSFVIALAADGPILEKAWFGQGYSADAHFGYAVDASGDVNGDGFDDLLVSAPSSPFALGHLRGRVSLFLGSPTGPEVTASWEVLAQDPDTAFGLSAAWAGDVNADGFDDVIVGEPYRNPSNNGRALVYLGSALGPELVPSWTFEGEKTDNLGRGVNGAGDVNGDGFDDVIVGAPDGSYLDEEFGLAHVFFGSPTGLEPMPAWTARSHMLDSDFGESVDSAGDVNGDGFDDVVIGARHAEGLDGSVLVGRAYVFLGSALGLAASPTWFAVGTEAVETFGTVAGVGDVDGDGFDDIVVSSPYADQEVTSEGRAFLYLGSPNGPTQRAAWSVGSGQESAYLRSVGAAGDVDGDGLDDVVVGWSHYDAVAESAGRASLYLGTPVGLSNRPAWTVTGNDTDSSLGGSLSGGDLNGDGWSDVVVGSPDEPTENAGRVRAYLAVPPAP